MSKAEKPKRLKLNKTARGVLLAFAAEVVAFPDLQGIEDKALAAVKKQADKELDERYPPADMVVLKRYNLSHQVDRVGAPTHVEQAVGIWVTVRHERWGRHAPTTSTQLADIQFICSPRDVPGRHTDKEFEPSDKLVGLWRKWWDAKEVRVKTVEATKRDYKALVDAAVHFEDVLTVWPEAERAREKVLEACSPAARGTALVVLSDEVKARIAADCARRMKPKRKKADEPHAEA